MNGMNGVTHHRLIGVAGVNGIAGVTVFAQKITGGVEGRWQMKMILLMSIHQIKVEMRRHTSIIRRQSLTKSIKRLLHSRKCLPRMKMLKALMKMLKALHRCSRDHGKDHGKIGKVPLHPNLQKVRRPSQRVTRVVWISGAHVILRSHLR